MLSKSFTGGFRRMLARPKLVLLIYLIGLLLASIIVIPFSSALSEAVGTTGFSETMMASGPDALLLWSDIMEIAGSTLRGVVAQLFWLIPIYILWKIASSVGIVYALKDEKVKHRFWSGVSKYTWRGFLLALPYFVLSGIATAGVFILALLLNLVWPGEVGTFRIYFVVLPTLAITVLAIVSLMHDFGKIALVVDHQKVMDAFLTGIRFPFKYLVASRLYILFFIASAVVWIIPGFLDLLTHPGSIIALWGLFLLQQVFLFLRSGISVAWLAGETILFETLDLHFADTPSQEATEDEDEDEF